MRITTSRSTRTTISSPGRQPSASHTGFADSEETPEGHIVRYDEHDRVIGVTIVGARDLLGQDGSVSLTLPRRSVTANSHELAAALAA